MIKTLQRVDIEGIYLNIISIYMTNLYQTLYSMVKN